MRSTILLFFVMSLMLAGPAVGQVSDDFDAEYSERVRAAEDPESTVDQRVAAAQAARFLRRYDEAKDYLASADAIAETLGDKNRVLRERLWLVLATGGGVEGVQEAFRRDVDPETPPRVMAGWMAGFPELLVGGEYDALIDRMNENAADKAYQCACHAPKGWRYRVAGDLEESQRHWLMLSERWDHDREFASSFAEADFRAQYALTLARSGDADHARRELQRAMTADLDAFASASLRRRRAQTLADLGDVEAAVEDLEYLLTNPSQVTVHTLESRMAWAPIRAHASFQGLLERHQH